MTTDISYCFKRILKIREIRDPGIPENTQRRLHGIPANHTPNDHFVGAF
jgi:hypothetical protein